MSLQDSAPIVAIATPPGRGGIGVVRLSGVDLQPFFKSLLGHDLKPRNAHYLPFLDTDGSLIDTGIAIYFQAPQSYTGEDVLELQAHGGPAVLQLLLKRCLEAGRPFGLRLAGPGEFSFRAFLNGKLDLAQAEAVADLINASSAAAAKAAASSLKGRFSVEVNDLCASLVALRTLVEATLDFPEEEIEFIEKYQVSKRLNEISIKIAQTLAVAKQSVSLGEGLKVVLAGEPNVGKSSLLNAIFDQEIAIVSEFAGTTRDRIRETLHLDGVPVQVTDTAGLRDTDDPIEKLGIERSWASIKDCDLILNVMDARQPKSVIKENSPIFSTGKQALVTVYNKIDLLTETQRQHLSQSTAGSIALSAKTGEGLTTLKQQILTVAGRQPGEVSPWLGRQRHVLALEAALGHLQQAQAHASLKDQVLDLLAEELRLAHQALGDITGQMTPDELLGRIFSTFCIGK